MTVELTLRETSLIASSLLSFIGILTQEDDSPHRDKLIEDCKDLLMKLIPEDNKKASTA